MLIVTFTALELPLFSRIGLIDTVLSHCVTMLVFSTSVFDILSPKSLPMSGDVVHCLGGDTNACDDLHPGIEM